MTLPPGLRKLALTAHITSSVGLLGSIAAFLALAVAGVTSDDGQTIRVVYPAMALIARSSVVPLSLAALLSGIIQSLGTPWGLFRHYWVLVKLVLTMFATIVLLAKLGLIEYASRLATEATLPYADLHMAGLQLVVHSAGGLLLLFVPVALSVYKPSGLTRYGRRRRPGRRTQPV